MTITERIKALETYKGCSESPPDPEDLEVCWRGRMVPLSEVCIHPVPFHNAAAVYEELTIRTADGESIKARHIRPAGEGPFPALLMFHDLGRGVRGWHHMTRFAALGYSVVAMENRVDKAAGVRELLGSQLERCITDALTVAAAAEQLAFTDTSRLVTFGEGFGGALAVITAALLPGTVRCAALNPMPADFGREGCAGENMTLPSPDYADPVSFARLLHGPLLIGTGLMDEIALPEGQYAIYNRADCPKRHLVYPKHGHERINFFENELLKFLHEEGSLC